ncbi:MAG: helix-turn-helix domain-containing protein [Burkholderiales bacterium]
MPARPKQLDLRDIGRRLRAYRLGAGASAAVLARKLGVSRAALYRIEDGQMIKIEVLERLAPVLGTSLASLLGAEVEYHPRALSYFTRMQQLEARAERIVAHFNPVSYLLTSDGYSAAMRVMLEEAVPDDPRLRARGLAEAGSVWRILEARKRAARTRRPAIVNLVGLPEIERLLHMGLVGRLDLPPGVREQRRAQALREIEHLVGLMQNEPLGVQIGLVEDVMPNVTFQLFYAGDDVRLAVSPFRLGELPNVRIGVASVTAAREAVSLYESLVDELWARALRGAAGARRLSDLLSALPSDPRPARAPDRSAGRASPPDRAPAPARRARPARSGALSPRAPRPR